jgi:hypothetical protein
MRRLGTCLASTNREALGFRPARNWVCHCELAGRGQASGTKTPCSRTSPGVCQVPGRTDQGFKTLRGSVGRRSAASGFRQSGNHAAVTVTKGAPFGAPSPLNVEGRELKAQLARRRGNERAWLFEILIGRNEAHERATFTAVIARLDRATQYSGLLRFTLTAVITGSPRSRG